MVGGFSESIKLEPLMIPVVAIKNFRPGEGKARISKQYQLYSIMAIHLYFVVRPISAQLFLCRCNPQGKRQLWSSCLFGPGLRRQRGVSVIGLYQHRF